MFLSFFFDVREGGLLEGPATQRLDPILSQDFGILLDFKVFQMQLKFL